MRPRSCLVRLCSAESARDGFELSGVAPPVHAMTGATSASCEKTSATRVFGTAVENDIARSAPYPLFHPVITERNRRPRPPSPRRLQTPPSAFRITSCRMPRPGSRCWHRMTSLRLRYFFRAPGSDQRHLAQGTTGQLRYSSARARAVHCLLLRGERPRRWPGVRAIRALTNSPA